MSAERVRKQLLQIFQAALGAAQGRERVACALARAGAGRWRLVAVGKAAASMTLGALDSPGVQIERGLIITKHGHLEPALRDHPLLTVLEAGHPLPDAASLAAGAALVQFVRDAPAETRLLFLVSGGASSLVEQLPAGVGLRDLRRLSAWLLGSGLDIHDTNRVRKGVSCIKGGRLASLCGRRPVLALMMSDVPGDDPADIGSGLLVADPEPRLPQGLPSWVAELARAAPAPPSPASLTRIDTRVVVGPADALEGARRCASELGCRRVHANAPWALRGDAVARGGALGEWLAATAPRGIHLWQGETTVTLPAAPGRGGRCQALALSAALTWTPLSPVALLAAGSDGTDGPGEFAGAMVDGGTLRRGSAAGLDPRGCLARADAGSFLEASGDLLRTGPTGTNVADLVIAVRW